MGAKAVGTVYLEPWFGSNPAKYPRLYVRAGEQPAKTKAVRVFGRFWNRSEPNRRSKPGPLAGYPDPLLTLAFGYAIAASFSSQRPGVEQNTSVYHP